MHRHAGNTTSPPAGQVVLHADDLGFNCAVTDGILHGFRRGLLTSTSLLANAPDAVRALVEWRQLLDEQATGCLPSAGVRQRLDDPAVAFDLGVHLNLTQGRPLSAAYPAELRDAAGRFCGVWTLFRRLRQPRRDWLAAVQAELAMQIEFLFDRGLRPTHLNGHQYIEMLPAVSEMLPDLLERYAIRVVRVAAERSLFRTTVLRNLAVPQWLLGHVKRWHALRFGRRMDAVGIAHADAFFGTAHAGRIDLRLMRVFLTHLAHHVGRSIAPSQTDAGRSGAPSYGEIGLHPGFAPPAASPADVAEGWHDPLAAHRSHELQLLVSAELADTIQSQRLRLGRLSTLVGSTPVGRPFQAVAVGEEV